MDSRGHGRSTRDARPYGYDLMALDVVALMDFLKVDKAAVVGWSDGALIGLTRCYWMGFEPERPSDESRIVASFSPPFGSISPLRWRSRW